MTDVTTEAARATRRARLAEQVLLDRVVERAKAEQTSGDLVALVRKDGRLELVGSTVAEVLIGDDVAVPREPLRVSVEKAPELAEQLRATARELLEAAAVFERAAAAEVAG